MKAFAATRTAHRNVLQHSAGPGTRVAKRALIQKVNAYPPFLPAEAKNIQEPAAQAMLTHMRRLPVKVPFLADVVVDTACVGPQAGVENAGNSKGGEREELPPVVLLHGFDSSGMEYRRLYPLLAQHTDTWTVDLAGWGFTDSGITRSPELVLCPETKREHLAAFWREHVGRPMVLVGASLGGAAALDFALRYPEAVSKLVLIDPQALVDGIGPMASLPRFLAGLGVDLLRTEPLRMAANKMAYNNKERFATEDAMRVGRLHTFMPGWKDGIVSFMLSGGYRVKGQLPKAGGQVAGGKVLVVWGRQDEILDPSTAEQMVQALPGAKLVWVDDCGHCAHLEQPEVLAQHIMEFISADVPAPVAVNA